MDEEEFLTQEQIDEILSTKYVFDYHVYFDKTDGTILAISNEAHPEFDTLVTVEFSEVERFFNNTEQHFNFKVLFDADGKPSFVHRHVTSNIKTNIVETIRVTDNDTVLTVVWTPEGWEFVIADSFLQHPRAKSLNSKLTFYVTLEDNINCLIREIDIYLRNLVGNGTIKVPFTTTHETKNGEISMFTLPFFESYGMKIHE